LSDDEGVEQASKEALDLMEQIRPLLIGKGAEVQSAALADLTAMWLAGMFLTDRRTGELKRHATDQMREHCLKVFIKTVRELTPVNEQIITKPLLDKRREMQ
jgi:hypothetical protein